MKLKALLCVVASFSLAATAAAETLVPVGQVFTLSVGECALVGGEGLRVGFDGAGDDGRCPIGVFCLWEGDAATHVWAKQPGHDRADLTLHTSDMFGREAAYDGYQIALLILEPYPVYEVPIDPDVYEATFVVTKVSTPTPVEVTTWSRIKALYSR